MAGMTCAVATGYLSSNSRIKSDTVMGVVFSGMFALGIVLTSASTPMRILIILFGNMLGVGEGFGRLGYSGFRGCWPCHLWKGILFMVLTRLARCGVAGELVARVAGGTVSHNCCDAVIVGLILAGGLMIAPGAIAFLLVRRFSGDTLGIVAVCMISMCGGFTPVLDRQCACATIILILTAVFIVACSAAGAVPPRLTRWGQPRRRPRHGSQSLLGPSQRRVRAGGTDARIKQPCRRIKCCGCDLPIWENVYQSSFVWTARQPIWEKRKARPRRAAEELRLDRGHVRSRQREF